MDFIVTEEFLRSLNYTVSQINFFKMIDLFIDKKASYIIDNFREPLEKTKKHSDFNIAFTIISDLYHNLHDNNVLITSKEYDFSRKVPLGGLNVGHNINISLDSNARIIKSKIVKTSAYGNREIILFNNEYENNYKDGKLIKTVKKSSVTETTYYEYYDDGTLYKQVHHLTNDKKSINLVKCCLYNMFGDLFYEYEFCSDTVFRFDIIDIDYEYCSTGAYAATITQCTKQKTISRYILINDGVVTLDMIRYNITQNSIVAYSKCTSDNNIIISELSYKEVIGYGNYKNYIQLQNSLSKLLCSYTYIITYPETDIIKFCKIRINNRDHDTMCVHFDETGKLSKLCFIPNLTEKQITILERK